MSLARTLVLALISAACAACSGGGGGSSGGSPPPNQPARAHPHMTFFGGELYERAQGIATAPSGEIYIAGHSSSDLAQTLGTATAGYASAPAGGPDAYAAILSADLSQLLAWTYFGGSEEERAYSVLVDGAGRVWIEGFSDSADLPTTDGSAFHGGREVFVARFSADLKQLEFSTLLGGSKDDLPRGSFFVDDLGQAYVGGGTASPDFPTTPGALQRVHAGGLPGDELDAFVTKLDPTGRIVWSTFLGGSANDSAFSGLQVFGDGSVFVAGMTNSADFQTTPGAFQPVYGGDLGSSPFLGDAFVARLSPDGTHLIYSNFLGGSAGDSAAADDGLEIEAQGRAVLIGMTASLDFPTTPLAFRRTLTGSQDDGFVARLSADGSQLQAATLFGGSGFEEASGVALDPFGNVHVSGTTDSADFPVTPGGDDRLFGGGSGDALLCKFAPDLRHLVHATFIGGAGETGFGDRGRAVVLGKGGAVALGGDSDSPDLETAPNALQPSFGGGNADALVATVRLDSSYTFGLGKPSSAGTLPKLSWSSEPSASAGSFVIRVEDGVPGAAGLLAWGPAPLFQSFPFGNWYVSRPITALPLVVLDPEGGAAYTIDVSPAMVGSTRVYQFRFVDPQSPDGTGIGLSNALKVTFRP